MKYENKYKPKDRIFDGWAILITWLIFWILIFDYQFNFIFKLLFIVDSWLSLFSMNITLVQLKIGVSVMNRNNAVHHNWKWSNWYVSMGLDSRPRSVLTTIISRKLEDLKSKWFEILSVIFCLTNKGYELIKYPEIFSPLECKKIRIGAIEIWVFHLFWPFIQSWKYQRTHHSSPFW